MKMLKKVLAIVLMLAIVVSAGVSAGTESAKAADGPNYMLTIFSKSGVEYRVNGPLSAPLFDKENSISATSGDGWSFDKATGTLTLNGCDLGGIEARSGKDQLTIVLKGENYVTKTGGEAWNNAVCIGRTSGDDITTVFKGDGKLTIDVGSAYMYCFGGDKVVFEDSVTLICNVHDCAWGEGTAYSATTTILGKDATIRATCSDYCAFTSSNEGWKDAGTRDQINGTLILLNTRPDDNKYAAMHNFTSGQTAIGSDRVIYCGKDMKNLVSGYPNIKYADNGIFFFPDYEDAYKNAKAVVICGKNDDLQKLVGYSAGTGKDKTKPDTVSVKKATSTKKGQITITWKKVSGASGYEIFTCKTKNGKFKKAGTIKKNAAKCIVKKLKSGSVIYVKVRAYTTSGGKKTYGDFSKVLEVKVK